jgi:hypothetical protein
MFRDTRLISGWRLPSCLQALLALAPDAAGVLRATPVLPPSLPDVTLRGLRMGQHSFDLRLRREGDETRMEALDGDASCVLLQA